MRIHVPQIETNPGRGVRVEVPAEGCARGSWRVVTTSSDATPKKKSSILRRLLPKGKAR